MNQSNIEIIRTIIGNRFNQRQTQFVLFLVLLFWGCEESKDTGALRSSSLDRDTSISDAPFANDGTPIWDEQTPRDMGSMSMIDPISMMNSRLSLTPIKEE